jgi:hypothetical protein
MNRPPSCRFPTAVQLLLLLLLALIECHASAQPYTAAAAAAAARGGGGASASPSAARGLAAQRAPLVTPTPTPPSSTPPPLLPDLEGLLFGLEIDAIRAAEFNVRSHALARTTGANAVTKLLRAMRAAGEIGHVASIAVCGARERGGGAWFPFSGLLV